MLFFCVLLFGIGSYTRHPLSEVHINRGLDNTMVESWPIVAFRVLSLSFCVFGFRVCKIGCIVLDKRTTNVLGSTECWAVGIMITRPSVSISVILVKRSNSAHSTSLASLPSLDARRASCDGIKLVTSKY